MWIMAEERLVPSMPIDEKLEMDFFRISMTVYPKYYGKRQVPCKWFLDKDGRMTNIAGKNSETRFWHRHLDKYVFHPRAISVGTFNTMSESAWCFWTIAEERLEEYVAWIDRMCEKCDDPKLVRMARAAKWAVLQEYYAETMYRERKQGGRRKA